MKDGNWIALHTAIKKWLPIKGVYDEVHAMISHTLDIDAGKDWSYSGYASLWGWSRTRVRKFMTDIYSEKGRTGNGTPNDTGKEQGVRVKIKNLEETKNREQDTQQDRQQDTTIHTTDLHTTDNTKTKKGKNGKFTPPTLQEVTDYCTERKNTINPQSFIDFYESKNWMVGKNKMSKWKSAVHTWEHKNKSSNKTSGLTSLFDQVQKGEWTP